MAILALFMASCGGVKYIGRNADSLVQAGSEVSEALTTELRPKSNATLTKTALDKVTVPCYTVAAMSTEYKEN